MIKTISVERHSHWERLNREKAQRRIKMKLRMRHVPNPDIPGGYYDSDPREGAPVEVEAVEIRVKTLAMASVAYRHWIDATNLGGGNIPSDSGILTESNGELVGRVSFNGRIWSENGTELYSPSEAYIGVTDEF